MERGYVALLAGAVVMVAAGHAWADDACAPPSPEQSLGAFDGKKPVRSYFKGRSDFWDGRLVSRACQIETLKTQQRQTTITFDEVAPRAAEVSRLYAARSGRQQIWLDSQSAVTGAAGVGYFASAGAGAATQAYWGYAALAPLMVSQFNAYEPTRDLFYGAAQGVDAITLRYRVIANGAAYLNAYGTAAAVSRTARQTACASLDAQVGAIINTWAANRPDKTTILPEAQRVAAACAAAAQADAEVDAFASALTASETLRAHAFATDVVNLDSNVVHRDHELRYTPFQTLTSIAAFPLQAASKLLTGEDGKQALQSLKTQAAFSNLDLDLQPVDLPPAPKALGDPLVLASNALARVDATVEDNAKDPARTVVQPAVKAMIDANAALNRERPSLGFRVTTANRIALAAAATRLSFRYDATNHAVAVTLAPPSATPAPLSQTGAGASSRAVN